MKKIEPSINEEKRYKTIKKLIESDGNKQRVVTLITQFNYACKQLGVDIKMFSVTQTKGRVERLFATLQSRIIIELRLANILSIEDTTAFLNEYIKKFNTPCRLMTPNLF